MTQSKYTLEIRTLLMDQNFKLFDFDYSFYNEDIKPLFENLFLNEYYYNEIGQETVIRFKQRLKHKLNLIYPYYKQLYDTEIASKGITFLLNKDLEETFIRDVLNDNISNSKTNYTGTAENNFKESNLDNGTAQATLTQDGLTTVSNSVDNVTNANTVENIGNNNTKEETKLISRGNIGTTSSAQLLKEWRAVLININELIIEECRELFMGVF